MELDSAVHYATAGRSTRADPTEATSLDERANLLEELRGKVRNVVITLDVKHIVGFIRLVSGGHASLGAELAEQAAYLSRLTGLEGLRLGAYGRQ